MGGQEGDVGVSGADEGGGPGGEASWESMDALFATAAGPPAWAPSSRAQEQRCLELREGSAAVADRVMRLERRLEIERRQLQRQLQRMERRMQDLFQAPAPNVGRWAELQGYVDGLAETVQGLLSSREASGPASPSRGADDLLGRSEVRALAARMDAVTEDVAALASRLKDAEQGLDGLAEAELDGRLQDLEEGLVARIQDLERGREDWAPDAAAEAHPSRQVAELCEQVAELRGRMRCLDRRAGCAAAAQLAAHDVHAVREELGEVRGEAADFRAALEGQLASLKEEVSSLAAWASDAECELKNQELSQLGEQLGSLNARVRIEESGLQEQVELLNRRTTALEELEAGRQHGSEKLEELEARLQLLREDHTQQSASSQHRHQEAMRSLHVALEAQRGEAEAAIRRLELRMEGPRALKEPAEPCAAQASQAGVLSLERHVAGGSELEELRNIVEDVREQQAELAVDLGLRAQEGQRCHQALAAVLDLRCEVEHLGRQLQELDARAREARRSQEEITGEVRALGACAGQAQVVALEGKVGEVERRLAEVAELADATNALPALQAQLSKLEQGLKEVAELADATNSLPALQAQLSKLEQGLKEVAELAGAANTLPALAVQVGRLDEGLKEVGELAASASSVPALLLRVSRLEEGLKEESAAREDAFSQVREIADRTEGLRGQQDESREQLGARLRKLEESSAAAAEALMDGTEAVAKQQRDLELDLRKAKVGLEEIHSRLSSIADSRNCVEAIAEVRGQQEEICGRLDERVRKLEETATNAMDIAVLRGRAESVDRKQQGMESDLRRAEHGLEELVSRVSSFAKQRQDFAEAVDQVCNQQGETREELDARLRKLEDVAAETANLSAVMDQANSVGQAQMHMEASLQEIMAGFEEQQRHVESVCKKHTEEAALLLQAQDQGQACISRLAALEGVISPISSQVLTLQKQTEDLQANWESRLSSLERATGTCASTEELRLQLEALGLGHSELEAGLREARGALEEFAARPAAGEAAVEAASLAFQRAHAEQSMRLGQRLAQVEQRLPEVAQLCELPKQLERLGLQHEEAEASLHEARRSVELVALKVNDLTASESRAGMQGSQESSPGKGSSRREAEQTRHLCERLDLLRGEEEVRGREEPATELYAAVEWLRQRQTELGANCEARMREVERGAHDSAGMRELRRQVQELAELTGRAREQQLLQEEQASGLGARLREAERRLGEALRGQLDRAWWEHAEELASGLTRAEERGLRQASSLEDLAGQLRAAREQIADLQTQIQELAPAGTTSEEVTELRTSLDEVYVAQAGLSTRLEAQGLEENGEMQDLRERLEELGRHQAELGARLLEVVQDGLGPRLDTMERCVEGLMQGQAAGEQGATSWTDGGQPSSGGRLARTWPPFAAGSQASPPRFRQEQSPGHEPVAAGSAQSSTRAPPYTPRGDQSHAQIQRRRSASADGAGDALGNSGLEQARAQARERLLSATARSQPQSARSTLNTTEPSACAGSSTSPPCGSSQLSLAPAAASTWPSLGGGSSADVEHINKELARRARLEAHRAEALGAVEARVAAVAEQLADLSVRFDEAENGLEAAGRGGVALRLRFEQLQSLMDDRLHALSSELTEVSARQLAAERSLADMASEGVREAQLRPLQQGPGRLHEPQAVADRHHHR